MKKFIFGSLLAIAGFTSILFAENSLTKVNILGREYYCYEVKKNESLYGIAHNMGWNEAELSKMNPAAAHKLKAGQKLYYPVNEDDASGEYWLDSFPMWHIAGQGETIYSIASLYNVPIDTLYQNNPNCSRGIMSGDTVIIRKGRVLPVSNEKINYVIKDGDTPLSVARKFHTTVASLWKNNPLISEDNFPAGTELVITPDLDAERVTNTFVSEEKIVAIKEVKVPDNSSWEGIARTNSIDVDVLKAANPDVAELKKNETLTIPVIQTVDVATTQVKYDPRELTEEGRREIYDSIQSELSPVEMLKRCPGISIAIVLSKPSSNKDVDFVRGFTTSLQNYVDEPYKINLKVIDGSGTVTGKELEGSDIIFATYEKDFPSSLVAISENMSVPLVNVFDVKADYYLTNNSFIQLLPPTEDFNRLVGIFLEKELAGKNLIFVGEPDNDDQTIQAVITAFPGAIKSVASIQQLKNLSLKAGKEYAIFSFARKKSEINAALEAISELRNQNQSADIQTIGRPGWMAYEESLRNQMGKANTCFPSRFYFDKSDKRGQQFQSDYKVLFRQNPVKSSPMYSVVGYDVANYFIPLCLNSAGDLNLPISGNSLQTYMNFVQAPFGLGKVNEAAYMLRFSEGGNIEKILLK